MSDVTRILSKIEAGDRQASEDLLPLVYDELRKLAAARMAGERPDHTLSATAKPSGVSIFQHADVHLRKPLAKRSG